MPERTTLPSAVTPRLFALLAVYRAAVAQERSFVRLLMLTLGSLLTVGRHSITQVLVTLGQGDADWSAWYRLFAAPRIAIDRVQAIFLEQALATTPARALLPVVLDATQLPRSSRRFPGSGFVRAPRTPAWRPGIHRGQRWEGLSLLLPRSAQGDSRTLPLRWELIRAASSQPCGDVPVRSEGAVGIALLTWLRGHLDRFGRATQRVLVIADGAYSTATVLRQLPHDTLLLARCAKNRALYALPTSPDPTAPGPKRKGRKRCYGERGPTPTQLLHQRTGWVTRTIQVRGRRLRLTVLRTGPWLVKPVPDHPLWLLVVKGVDRRQGARRRRREPTMLMVSAVGSASGPWRLPAPLEDLLAWAWQRWEVEVMHRELKSGFGLGEQQAWAPTAVLTVVPWVVWTYGMVVLAGYQAWGYAPPPGSDRGRWWRPRRWSIGRLLQQTRVELWRLGEFQPVWARSPDAWAEMETWLASATNAARGHRRL